MHEQGSCLGGRKGRTVTWEGGGIEGTVTWSRLVRHTNGNAINQDGKTGGKASGEAENMVSVV